MLTISDDAIRGFETQHRRRRFLEWWVAHQHLLSSVPTMPNADWLGEYAGEAEVAGIGTDEQLFVYVAGRRRLLDPEPAQYIALMDVVFSSVSDTEKLKSVERIARTVDGDGH
ncbi:MAG TPA: hypothetical protein VEL28_18330 [Candidatus Binatia bacterium]|nr:hypothetical protein [Candidatus Binatia bacterium]